nr:hypothetical protein [Halopenitus persicus]
MFGSLLQHFPELPGPDMLVREEQVDNVLLLRGQAGDVGAIDQFAVGLGENSLKIRIVVFDELLVREIVKILTLRNIHRVRTEYPILRQIVTVQVERFLRVLGERVQIEPRDEVLSLFLPRHEP